MVMFDANPILLSEEDSRFFVNELSNPSAECKEQRDRLFEMLDSQISICDMEDGFVAEIDDSCQYSSGYEYDFQTKSASFEGCLSEIYRALMNWKEFESIIVERKSQNDASSVRGEWNNDNNNDVKIQRKMDHFEHGPITNSMSIAA